MKIEEVLPALRAGKPIQRTSQPIQWAYLKLSDNGAFHWYGYGDDPGCVSPMHLDHTHLLADDWVIVAEDVAKARKPAPEFNCGRRGSYSSAAPLLDYWQSRDGRRACSYCGSAHQDDVMAMAEAGTIQFGPTDKSYKAYLTLVPTPEDEQRARDSAKTYGIGEMIFKEKGEAAFEEYWQQERGSSVHGKDMGKFYFQHLTPGQRSRFVELLNERKLHIGFPGHFYQLPYFLG